MPPVVRLALLYRLIGSEWWCPTCAVGMIGGYGGWHIMTEHPLDRWAKRSWVNWFDREVASMWL